MVRAQLRVTALLLAAACASGPWVGERARAQDSDFGATTKVSRPLAATNREDPTASGTELVTQGRDAAHESVADLLLEVPGAHALRSGWLGSFTSASLRGADAQQTQVLLGEIPLTFADAAAFDLSTIPVSALDRMVVYRGGAPAWLSQGAIGGVIQLLPRSAESSRLSATGTAGSFGTYGGSAQSSVVPGSKDAPALLTAAGTLGSRGDFQFMDDNKTALDPSDDHLARRKNADFIEGHGLVHLRQRVGPGALELVMLGYERTGGEPGSPADPAYQARRHFARGLLGVDYTIERDDEHGERVLRLQVLGAASFTRARFTDLFGEIGPVGAKRTDDLDEHAFGRLAGSVALARFIELTLVGSGQHDERSSDNPLTRVPMPDSGRDSLSGVAELNLHGRIGGHRVELRPSARIESTAAQLHSERFGQLVRTQAANVLNTYRAAAGVEVLPDLTLSGSVATGARTPSMLELFGDGAFILGDTALRPERSTSYDVGLTDVACTGDFASSVELRAFDLGIEDEISFVRNSFSQLFPMNLDHAHIRGIEAGAHVNFGTHLWLVGATTLLDTEGKSGKHLPNRPRAIAFLQPGVSAHSVGPFDEIRTFVSGHYTASSYDDPDNATPPKPSQLFIDAGTSWFWLAKRAEARLTVSDLFDRGGQDLRHFPLPGRTVMASFTYKEDLR
ncbi:MAG TPA: TonB-dependent receptor [Polyangiales bacterium]